METPLSDDEKRALLAEAIKTSNVDPEALAGFVGANCPTYDILAVKLPNGRSLHQCTQALERMLGLDGYNSLPHTSTLPTALTSSDTFPVRPAPQSSSPIYLDMVPQPRPTPVPPKRRPFTERCSRSLWQEPQSISPSADSFSSKPLKPHPTQSPRPRRAKPTNSSPRESPLISAPLISAGRRVSRAASPSTRCRVNDYQFADRFWERADGFESLLKLQAVGKRSRDGEKNTSNIGDADTHTLDIHISDGSDSSSTVAAKPPKRIVEDTSLTTDEICNTVLKAAFSTSLDELDTPTEVWESIYHCVGEISHIIGHHDHHMAQNGPPQPAGSGATDLGGSYRHRPAKRQRRKIGASCGFGGSDDGEDVEENDQGANPNEGAPNMKQRRHAGLGCPFRKRNSLRFNVRSHLNCSTQTFSSITLLKRHVVNFHKRPAQTPLVTCARCGDGFSTQAGLDGHLRAELGDMCRVGAGVTPESAPDPEDGIGPEVLDRLRDRTAKRQVLDWATLWKVLFPGDDIVPGAEFNPVVELDEVEAIFQNELDTLPPAVGGRLQTAIELSCGIPAATALAEAACHVFTGFFAGITQKSRATLGPVVKTRQLNRPALPPSTQTTVAPYSDALGRGQLPSFIPAPDTAHPSLCPDCFQPESTSCICFHIPAFGLDFDPTIWGSSAPNSGFASSQASTL